MLTPDYSLKEEIKNIVARCLYSEFEDKVHSSDLRFRLENLALLCSFIDIREIVQRGLIKVSELPVVYINTRGYLLIAEASDLPMGIFNEIPRGKLNLQVLPHFLTQNWQQAETTKIYPPGNPFFSGNLIFPHAFHLVNRGALPALLVKSIT